LALSDKFEHMAMYAAMAVLPAICEPRRVVLALAMVSVGLGVALEYVQWFTGWRDFEYGDMVASAIGVGVGLGAGVLLRAARRLKLLAADARNAAQPGGLELPATPAPDRN
jgi:VanZ family protein